MKKLRLYDEKNLKIIVKMAKMYEIEHLLRGKVTKFKKKETKF